jgi:alpha-L-fucosidase
MIPAVPKSSQEAVLRVKYARTTQKWIEGTKNIQIVEVVIQNVGNHCISRNNSVSVSVKSAGLETVRRATIKRLAPGDQVEVEVGVANFDLFSRGKSGSATIVIEGLGVVSTNYSFDASYGVKPYRPTYESIYSHESPDWFNNAKFGIFIHWGPYAVPAWGNIGRNETYAEWYVLFET